MSPSAVRSLRLAAAVLGVCLLAVAAAGVWLASRVRASLPRLDGEAALPGVGAAVAVERDALGVPTLRGANRADVARALGWLHAQDRFFQMDVLRRAGAGELAALFGERAVPRDRATRMHGFRALAGKVVASLPAAQRVVLDAYVAGVNAGLADLGAKPFEYLLLRADPAPWRAEDSVLTGYAMMLDLQDSSGNHERSLMTLRDVYGADSLGFFAPVTAPDDAALDGTTAALPAIPGPKVINVRAARTGMLPTAAGMGVGALASLAFPFAPRDPDSIPGSNALALDGAHTAGGGGLLANDMHLGHSVPNIWYRVSLEMGGRRVTGVTLPGTPAVIAGSNGEVAWGVTVANADTTDLVVVETVSASKRFYRAPGREDYVPIEIRKETIEVKGGDPVSVDYEWTIWGPVVGRNDRDRPLALRWIAHDVEAANFALLDMETARTTEEAIAVAHRAGVTPVNCVIADRAGEVAWTVAGRLPKRAGYDGRLPVTWTFGDRKWDGHLAPAEIPVVRGPASSLPGRIWSGHQRQAGGEALARLGEGGYAPAARARQLRDGLAPLSRATPADLLKVQLDDRAFFLSDWRDILLAALTPEALAGSAQRTEVRRLVERWEGRAEPGSVSYRLVAEFRQAVRTRVF
ncbi:MAG: penicillin acylase family protein, partial [Opitutaceae bacterium]